MWSQGDPPPALGLQARLPAPSGQNAAPRTSVQTYMGTCSLPASAVWSPRSRGWRERLPWNPACCGSSRSAPATRPYRLPRSGTRGLSRRQFCRAGMCSLWLSSTDPLRPTSALAPLPGPLASTSRPWPVVHVPHSYAPGGGHGCRWLTQKLEGPQTQSRPPRGSLALGVCTRGRCSQARPATQREKGLHAHTPRTPLCPCPVPQACEAEGWRSFGADAHRPQRGECSLGF